MQEEVLKGYRLSPQQRHLWMSLRQGRSAPYQAKCAMAIKGRLDSARLKSAAQDVIARHEILRTTFQCLPGMTIPMQVIEETGGILWREDDLSERKDQTLLIEEFFSGTSQAFEFERGPSLSLHLI